MNKYLDKKGLTTLVNKIKETNIKEYADSPIGTILPYGGATAPTGYLLCDGTAVSRTDYANLFEVIGESFGAGDGSTTFNLPDMRESVPKGAGLTGKTVGAHLDADGLAVGEFLDDRIQNITGSFAVRSSNANDGNITSNGSGAFTLSDMTAKADRLAIQAGFYKINKINLDASSVARAGVTTEVKSVGVNYIIKAKMVGVPADFEGHIKDVVNELATSEVSENNKLVTENDLSYVVLNRKVLLGSIDRTNKTFTFDLNKVSSNSISLSDVRVEITTTTNLRGTYSMTLGKYSGTWRLVSYPMAVAPELGTVTFSISDTNLIATYTGTAYNGELIYSLQ